MTMPKLPLFDLGLNINIASDVDYINYVNDTAYSIYFAGFNMLPDARGLSDRFYNPQLIINSLRSITSPKKYLLLNGITTNYKAYFEDSVDHRSLINQFKLYTENDLIDGIVFYDYYLLNTLKPYINPSIDIVPSINLGIDNIQKAESIFNYVQEQFGRIPTKLILDRSLARDINGLKTISTYIREYYPEIKIELIVNEGCMLHCPYKNSHDTHIAMSTLFKTVPDYQEKACSNFNKNNGFSQLLTSPFIRPEDVQHVLPYVDILKIAGRNFGHKELVKIVTAYKEQRYDWNLLELVEVFNNYAKELFVFSDQFPSDFYARVSTCNKNCRTCGYCTDVFNANHQILKTK